MTCTPAPDSGQPHWPELPHAAVACVLSHIRTTADRKALRSVCKAWRESADGCWRRAAYVCSWLPDPEARQPKAPATERFLRCGALLFPALRSLDLLELRASFKLRELLALLTPARLPHLASLGVSCPLLEGWSDGGALRDLPLADQLASLRLYGLTVDGGLPALAARFRGLTELVLSAQLDAGTADPPSVDAVGALAALPGLQALELPALGQEARAQLSALSGLTRLAFEAAGEGAVGASLLPALAPSLRRLSITLHLRKEMFIVLHPQVRFDLLAQLTRLESLEISNLAAYTWAREPGVWSDEPPPAEQAARLLQALPALRSLRLRAAFCRLLPEAAEAEGGALPPLALADGRVYAQTLTRVPVRRPGHRRPADWYGAWWQPDVQAALARSLGEGCPSLVALREHVTEAGGWVLLDRHSSKTYDALGCWRLRER